MPESCEKRLKDLVAFSHLSSEPIYAIAKETATAIAFKSVDDLLTLLKSSQQDKPSEIIFTTQQRHLLRKLNLRLLNVIKNRLLLKDDPSLTNIVDALVKSLKGE